MRRPIVYAPRTMDETDGSELRSHSLAKLEAMKRRKAAMGSVIKLSNIEIPANPSASPLVQELTTHILNYQEVAAKVAGEQAAFATLANQNQNLLEQYSELQVNHELTVQKLKTIEQNNVQGHVQFMKLTADLKSLNKRLEETQSVRDWAIVSQYTSGIEQSKKILDLENEAKKLREIQEPKDKDSAA